jgi:hypothetical protein
MLFNFQNYKKISIGEYEFRNNIFSNFKYIIISILIISFILIYLGINNFYYENTNRNKVWNIKNNKLIEENFFIIDSNNLENIVPHLYGYIISNKGILTDNYYKEKGKYENPSAQGVYIMIRIHKNKIIINQDYSGSFGLYIYENVKSNYFVISNSFLLLEEYMIGKQNISFNKDFADNLIITDYISFSIEETLIKEIKKIPSNTFLEIHIKKKKL